MNQEIAAHEILQLIFRKKSLWEWQQKFIYTDGIDKTVLKNILLEENNN